MKLKFLGLSLAAAIATPAMAGNLYLGVEQSVFVVDYSAQEEDHYSSSYYGYDNYVYQESDTSLGDGLRLTFGGRFNPYFGLEAYFAKGILDAPIDVGNGTFDLKLDQFAGVNAVAMLPLGRVVVLYGKAGFASVKYKDDSNSDLQDSGASFGAGIKFNTGTFGAVTVDSTVLPDAKYHKRYDYSTYSYVHYVDYRTKVKSFMFSLGYQFNFR